MTLAARGLVRGTPWRKQEPCLGREWGEALGGPQLQMGLAQAPSKLRTVKKPFSCLRSPLVQLASAQARSLPWWIISKATPSSQH